MEWPKCYKHESQVDATSVVRHTSLIEHQLGSVKRMSTVAPLLAVEKVDMLKSRAVNSREAIAERSSSWSAEVVVASACPADYRVEHISSRYAQPLARSGVRYLESSNISSCLVPGTLLLSDC